MKFFKKLRDVKPGEIIVQVPLEGECGVEHCVQSALLPLFDIPKNAWGVEIELHVRVNLVVPPEGDEG